MIRLNFSRWYRLKWLFMWLRLPAGGQKIIRPKDEYNNLFPYPPKSLIFGYSYQVYSRLLFE
jgi:hypothetical protein